MILIIIVMSVVPLGTQVVYKSSPAVSAPGDKPEITPAVLPTSILCSLSPWISWPTPYSCTLQGSLSSLRSVCPIQPNLHFLISLLMFIRPVISHSFSLDITLGHQIFMIYRKLLFTKDWSFLWISRVTSQVWHPYELIVGWRKLLNICHIDWTYSTQ
jgi:hypothetical protein